MPIFLFLGGVLASKAVSTTANSAQEFISKEIAELRASAFRRSVVIGAVGIGVFYYLTKGK